MFWYHHCGLNPNPARDCHQVITQHYAAAFWAKPRRGMHSVWAACVRPAIRRSSALFFDPVGSACHVRTTKTYLLQDEIKWAMASRSEEKLHKLRSDLAETHCSTIQNVPILTAEVNDPKSLDRLVKQCDVIISTAGPFWSIGIPVV